MKTCGKCKELKYEVDFVKNRSKKDGLSNVCKKCKKEIDSLYYKQHKNRREQINARRIESKTANNSLIREYLLNHPCVDCGNTDIRVLEFDHVNNDKEYNIGAMRGMNSDKMLSEISKCKVRCANCHKIRHSIENNSWRNN